MATPLDYKPRHKKPHAFAGSTPRGPERWARAMHNAWRNPNSDDALLFYNRLQLARMAKSWRVQEGTFAMFKFHRTSGWGEHRAGEWKVDYYCCSVFCAGMNAQLDMRVTNASMLVDVLNGVTVTSDNRVLRQTPSRTARCQFCGSRVKP